ncbi:MAG TPA: hybrid sensor histidine kinase/response regulator [Bacteroidota bacterium]|nr:hybrid sensor histidine kinase/response regulator [Bacteroidota bacterium]
METAGTKILVVDDTEDNLDLLEFALKRKPVNMFRATSGKQCLSMALEHQPDVILLDIQMPEMDGFETLQRLRADSRTAKIPVIFLTAQRKDPTSIEKGLLLGADEYLTKPIDTEELLVRTRTLVRLKKAEEELERTKADFMAMLVHDLRSPLSGIKSVIDFILEITQKGKPLTEEYVELLRSSQDSAKRMLGLINDILDLSKFEAGSMQITRKPVHIAHVIQAVAKQLELRFQEKQVKLSIESPEELPYIFADRSKLEQVMMNLLTNALKFTKAGGSVSVKAKLIEQQSAGNGGTPGVLHVSVEDTGVGIPKGEIPHVFERYRQLSSSAQSTEKGTGLGLAICKLIVEAHGGRIGVESTQDKGATFYFTIPLTAKQQPTERVPQQ